jgi:hypothetical protein
LFFIVGFFDRFDVIKWVVLGNKLQRLFNTIDKVLLTDNSHRCLLNFLG